MLIQNVANNNSTVYHSRFTLSTINGSQLAKMKKEYSWRVPAMKFIGTKQLV